MTYKDPKSDPTKNMAHHLSSLSLIRKKQGNAEKDRDG